jgi:hypothetical protein
MVNANINVCPETFNLWVAADKILHILEGAPASLSRAVRDVPGKTYHDRSIGRGAPTAWSQRSQNLNPHNLTILPVRTTKNLKFYSGLTMVYNTGFWHTIHLPVIQKLCNTIFQ